MDIIFWIIIIICGIGAIILAGFSLIAFISLYWIAIPIIGLFCGGIYGLCFGVGLTVIIFGIKTSITNK